MIFFIFVDFLSQMIKAIEILEKYHKVLSNTKKSEKWKMIIRKTNCKKLQLIGGGGVSSLHASAIDISNSLATQKTFYFVLRLHESKICFT